jgi:gas vesicle protein
VWKGLIVGGLAGAAAGVALDVGKRGSQLGGTAAKRTADLAPKAADRLKSAATTGAARVQDAVQDSELRDHVRDQVKEIAHRLADADVADQAREKLERATKKGAELAHSVVKAVPLPGAD